MAPTRKRPIGWILVGLLLGLYLIIKLQGWGYARHVRELESQLDQLRPALSAIVLYGQLKTVRQACLNLTQQVQTLDLKGAELVERLSRDVPPSITVEEIHLRSPDDLSIWGRVWPGVRPMEQVLVSWAGTFQTAGNRIRIRDLAPPADDPHAVQFLVEVKPE